MTKGSIKRTLDLGIISQEKFKKLLSPNMKRILRKFIKFGSHLLFPLRCVLALPWLLLVLIIRPFTRLKFAHIGLVDHIGWLAQLPEAYLREWEFKGKPERTHIVVLMYKPDNIALFDIYKRHLHVVSCYLINLWANFIAPVMKPFDIFIYDHEDYFSFERYVQTGPALSLNTAEQEKGITELKKMGISSEDWYVCFHTRDSSHYECDAHSYRNSDIDDCLLAMEEITKRGGYAIRVGWSVDNKLKCQDNPKIIDYASNFRSDFMDIYLAATNRFFLGTTSGIVCVAIIFNKIFGMANAIPHCSSSMRRDDPYIPKLIKNKEGQVLSFNEVKELKLFETGFSSEGYTEYLKTHALSVVDNSPEEVLDMCLDMLDIVDGKEPSLRAIELQELYREKFTPYLDYHFAPRISPRFALRHEKLIRG